MSQHCRANPCCGDRPCSGIPLPQHASGLPSHNKDDITDLRARCASLEAERDKLKTALRKTTSIRTESGGDYCSLGLFFTDLDSMHLYQDVIREICAEIIKEGSDV